MSSDGHDHGRPRYLTAKRSVDERAVNQRVQARLRDAVPDEVAVVEWGFGAGLTLPELFDGPVCPTTYRGIDADPRAVAFARHLIPRVLARRGYAVRETDGCHRAAGCAFTFVGGDALSAPSAGAARVGHNHGNADLLVAQSFFDLVPVPAALDAARATLGPDGVAYAPVTFDGETRFQPTHPADEAVLEAFHADIDATPGGQSDAAQTLRRAVEARGGTLIAVGESNWVVRPQEGEYPADEAYFLGRILEIIAGAAAGAPAVDEWLVARREQLAAGELTYRARNRDLLWRPAHS